MKITTAEKKMILKRRKKVKAEGVIEVTPAQLKKFRDYKFVLTIHSVKMDYALAEIKDLTIFAIKPTKFIALNKKFNNVARIAGNLEYTYDNGTLIILSPVSQVYIALRFTEPVTFLQAE